MRNGWSGQWVGMMRVYAACFSGGEGLIMQEGLGGVLRIGIELFDRIVNPDFFCVPG